MATTFFYRCPNTGQTVQGWSDDENEGGALCRSSWIAIAEAHRKDLEIQDKYGVKYMTYWFDAERCTGFCLVDAPDAATAAHVHREAHGEVASEIIPVDLAVVEAFLGRMADPRLAPSSATTPQMDAGLRAVMFTDIVGSTEMTARLGDVAALELVRAHDALVRRGLASHYGREVKHTGDGIMAAFDKVSDAVSAAADIQRHFSVDNAEASQSLSVRIGIHAGEVPMAVLLRSGVGEGSEKSSCS